MIVLYSIEKLDSINFSIQRKRSQYYIHEKLLSYRKNFYMIVKVSLCDRQTNETIEIQSVLIFCLINNLEGVL